MKIPHHNCPYLNKHNGNCTHRCSKGKCPYKKPEKCDLFNKSQSKAKKMDEDLHFYEIEEKHTEKALKWLQMPKLDKFRGRK